MIMKFFFALVLLFGGFQSFADEKIGANLIEGSIWEFSAVTANDVALIVRLDFRTPGVVIDQVTCMQGSEVIRTSLISSPIKVTGSQIINTKEVRSEPVYFASGAFCFGVISVWNMNYMVIDRNHVFMKGDPAPLFKNGAVWTRVQ